MIIIATKNVMYHRKYLVKCVCKICLLVYIELKMKIENRKIENETHRK